MEIFDTIIVGGGPGGLSAFIYLLLAKKNVICIEKGAPGGKLNEISKIKNFPFENEISGPELANKIRSNVNSLNGKIVNEDVTKITKEDSLFKVSTNLSTYFAKYIILAIGTKTGHYGFEGEEKFIGKGVSYCATCDGFFFRKKTVCVIGNNQQLIDSCLYLSNICEKIYAIPLQNDNDYELQSIMNLKNIEILKNTTLLKIEGVDNVNSILTDKGSFDVSGVFIFGDSVPSSSIYAGLNLNLENGYICVNDKQESSVENFFCCGDCINKKIRQIINASSEGMTAAIEVINRLNKSR